MHLIGEESVRLLMNSDVRLFVWSLRQAEDCPLLRIEPILCEFDAVLALYLLITLMSSRNVFGGGSYMVMNVHI